MPAASPVVSALLPVVLLIAAGWVAGRRGWITAGAVPDLSNLIFVLLAPALLFRTMSTVHLEQLSFRPVAAYFVATGLVYGASLLGRGFSRESAVLALASTYSNTVMIGIPLVSLAYGPPGMVTLLTLVSLHSLVLLTGATVVLELAAAREEAAAGHAGKRHVLATVGRALRSAVLSPVVIPVLAGLLFAASGLTLPEVVDRPLNWLGQAFSPLALVLVGVTLASTPIGHHLRGALAPVLAKNVAHPLLVLAFAWLLGARGLPLTVMVVAAALPMGANTFMFAQRYRVAEDLVTSSVVLSTLLALLTVSGGMLLMGWIGAW